MLLVLYLELATPLAQKSLKKPEYICNLLSATWEHHLSLSLKNNNFRTPIFFLDNFNGPYHPICVTQQLESPSLFFKN